MRDAVRSIVAAGGVVLGCGAVFGGIALRSRVDFAGTDLTASNRNTVLSTWVASRDNSVVNVSAADYYAQMVDLLKQYYVEQITNDQKLATGSVRGMISSLNDPRSTFLDPSQFRALLDRQRGIYQGIGADLTLELAGYKGKGLSLRTPHELDAPPEDAQDAAERLPRVPRLIVSAVVPGGPADRAGVRIGDQVTDIDGHWVVDESLLNKFRTEQRLFTEKKIKFSDIAPLQRELRKKIERDLLPMPAAQRLLIGKEGSVTVSWARNGTARTTKIDKGISRMPGFAQSAGVVRLSMTEDSVKQLTGAIKGRSAITIDLRDEPEGEYDVIQEALQALAPSGNYGEFVTSRREPSAPLLVSSGNPNPPKITLLVDRSTDGPAAILASALSSHGRAILKGSEMGGDLTVRQTVQLADGSGYTLVTGEYQSKASKPSLVAAAEVRGR
jgi:carboxyl-terminal processing protease